MSKPLVALLMGSKSDLAKIESGIQVLRDFEVPFVVRVMSAHRTPETVAAFAAEAQANGIKVLVCAAGCAAHLAGVVAAHSALPVIGIPVEGGPFKGMDALLSTVQMPGGIPVATVAVGRAGGKNAALLAVRILALADAGLRRRLGDFHRSQAEAVSAADAELQDELRQAAVGAG